MVDGVVRDNAFGFVVILPAGVQIVVEVITRDGS